MRLLALPAFLLCLISCKQKDSSEPFRRVFLKTAFDTVVIKNLYLYDSLRNIIISHIDTIFKYKNERHFVSNGKGNHIQEDANEYMFNYYADDIKKIKMLHGTVEEARQMDPNSLQNMPAFIYPSVESIFKKIGSDRIRGFRIYADSTIVIDIRSSYNEEAKGYISHTLKWDRFYEDNTDIDNFSRDTLLSPKWVYSFFIIDRN